VTTRLSSVAADLVERLERQPPARLRRATADAVGLAIARTGLVDPRLDAALTALRDGAFGETPERSGVVQLAGELDETAWDVQDKAEAGEVTRQAYLAAFAKARAAAPVGFALDSDALNAALESVHETQAAVADLEVVREVVSAALG
jgi:hypothetical protein